MCLYCRGSFPSKLRLTDHRVGGCSCGPVNSSGARWELPVYPNLKTAKQGKDLKLALQRRDGELWDNLHEDAVWLKLNTELKEVILPPNTARVQVCSFMEPTLERLTATPPPPRDFRPPAKGKAPLPPRPTSAPSHPPHFVEIASDESEEDETPLVRVKKRSHAEVEGAHRVFVSKRQFRATPRQHRSPATATNPMCRATPTEPSACSASSRGWPQNAASPSHSGRTSPIS